MIILFSETVQGSHDLAAAVINTRYAFADVTDHLIMETAAKLCQALHANFFIPVFSDEGHRCIHTDIRNISYVYHKLIHADTAEDRRALSADQHITTVG